MSKVYVFLADGFEEIEGLTVVNSVEAQEEVVTISIMGRKNITTGSHNIQVQADALF